MSVNLTNALQNIQSANINFKGTAASREIGTVLADTATVTWAADGYGNIQATATGVALNGTANQVLATPNGSTGAAALRALVEADLPATTASTDKANTFTSAQSFGIVNKSVGAQITAATTIAPTSNVQHITGATAVSTITLPAGAAAGWVFTLIPDDVSGQSTTTGGNIALGSTLVQHKALILTYDGTSFYPSY